MGERFRIRQIVDRDPFDGRVSLRGPDDVSPDSSETVDPYSDCHLSFLLHLSPRSRQAMMFVLRRLYHHMGMCQRKA
jgi:hypothetical protein